MIFVKRKIFWFQPRAFNKTRLFLYTNLLFIDLGVIYYDILFPITITLVISEIYCDSTDRAYSNKVYRTRTCVETKGEIA